MEHSDKCYTRDLEWSSLKDKVRIPHRCREVVLSYQKLGDTACEAVGKALQKNVKVTTLWLNGNRIGPRGVAKFVDALLDGPESSALLFLDLTGNPIGDDGARALARFLETDPQLHKLVMKQTQVEDAGAEAINEALDSNTHLEEIRLGFNTISWGVFDKVKLKTQLHEVEDRRKRLRESGTGSTRASGEDEESWASARELMLAAVEKFRAAEEKAIEADDLLQELRERLSGLEHERDAAAMRLANTQKECAMKTSALQQAAHSGQEQQRALADRAQRCSTQAISLEYQNRMWRGMFFVLVLINTVAGVTLFNWLVRKKREPGNPNPAKPGKAD